MDERIVSKFTQYTMMCVGMWPYRSDNKYLVAIYKVYSKLIRYIGVLVTILLLGRFPNLYQNAPDGLFYQVGVAVGVCMLILKHIKSDERGFIYLINEAMKQSEAIQNSGRDAKEIYRRNVKIIYRIVIYLSICINVSASFLLGSFYIETMDFIEHYHNEIANNINMTDSTVTGRQPLIFDIWMPFDRKEHYVLVIIINFYLMIVLTLTSCACDCAYLTLIINSICDIQVVKHQFEHFDQIELEAEDQSRNFDDYWKLRACIIKHQKIIKDLEILDEFIKSILFVDFFTRSLQLASVLMELMSNLEDLSSLKFYWAVCYFIFTASQLFLIYWYANEIRVESMDIANALYRSNWYEKDVKIRKMILIVMMRAQKCLTLHVGGLYPVSNDIIVRITKTFYSLTTIMQNVST